MSKRIIYRFIFESEKKENLDINSSIQDFIDKIVPDAKLYNTLKNIATNQFLKKYHRVILNKQILQRFETKYYDLLIEYFKNNPRLKLLLAIDSSYMDSVFHISLLKSLKEIIEKIGNLEFLFAQDLTLIKLFTENLNFKTLKSYENGLFKILDLQTLSKYEEIKSYIKEFEKNSHNLNEEIDLKIKNLIVELIEEKVDEKIGIYESFINNETRSLNQLIDILIKDMLSKHPEFQELRQKQLDLSPTKISKQIRKLSSSLYDDLYHAWQIYEIVFLSPKHSLEEKNIAEQKFKIAILNICIQVKKYLEELKKNNKNKWLIAWVVKLLKNLNLFLSIAKSDKNQNYGFNVFPKEKNGLVSMHTLTTSKMIKEFLKDRENIKFLFPQELKNLPKTLNAFQLFFDIIERFFAFEEEPLEFDEITLPELLSVMTTI
jgi:hypothetical protein